MSDDPDEEENVIHVEFGAAEEEGADADVDRPDPAPGSDEKLDIFAEMVDAGTVMVTLDARRDDVVVPSHHDDDFRLNLNFCHLFRIPDFEYDLHGVRASLSFGGRDIYCDVPWSSVYMLRSHVDNEVVVFPRDLPEEMMMLIPEIERALRDSNRELDSDEEQSLRLVDDGEVDET